MVQLSERNAWKLFFMADKDHEELSDVRSKLRLTQRAMAVRLGVPEARYKNWEYGRASVPALVLAKAKAMLRNDPLPDVGPPEGPVSESEVLMPFIGRVAASSPASWSDPLDADLTEPVPVHMMSLRGMFCCRIEGDSMTPLLQPDDLAVFKSAEFARAGLVVLYRHNGQDGNGTVTVKQLKHEGAKPMLKALNPAYESSQAHGTVVGILVGIVRTIGQRTITDFDPDGLKPEFV